MARETKITSPVEKTLKIPDIEEIKRAMTLKYYDDCIVLKNNRKIELQEEVIQKAIDSKFSMKLPNNKNIYFYSDDFKDQYYFLEGSKQYIEKKYMDELRVTEVKISFESSGNIKVIPYIVEYHNSEIIDILETENNKIYFQPNTQTDAFKIMFKLQGEGFLFNFRIDVQSKERSILEEKTLKFHQDDFFLNKNLISFPEEFVDDYLILSVKPNEKKHIYISYLEKNNKYSEKPKNYILDEIDLKSNLLIEFNVLKDETLDFIPMLIEYDEDKKIGVKNLNIYNPEIYSLKSGTENVRLAFRISGHGNININSIKFISLQELPENHKLSFEDRYEVVKLLSPTMLLSQFKVASIMDEFTYSSFNPEVQLHRLDFNKWKSELLFIQPDIVFIESAWVGNNGKWHRKVAYYDEEQHKDIKELIKFAQNLKIPVIFWNKEDPVHYHRFIETAKLCDFVFTTDKGRVNQYIKDCGHSNVEALPFAAQPKNHNPIKIQRERDSRVSFAGSYYRHHEERSRDMDVLLEASKEIGLVIFDRNYHKTRKGQMPNHMFPDRFEPYIEGTLPFNLIDRSYKGYKFMVNVNTVKYSETMFSRRVFEGLLSGTPIISNYSLGMKKMFGDIINSSSNIKDLKLHLKHLEDNQELYNKYALEGIREILLNHTYSHRMKYILNKVGYNILSSKTNVYFIAFVEKDEDIKEYIYIFNGQTVLNKKLIIVHKNIENYLEFYENYNTERMIGIDYKALKKYVNLRQLLGTGVISVLDKNNFYAKNYALDLVLAESYSRADIIGKSMFYSQEDKDIRINNNNSDYIYTNDIEIDRSIVNVAVFDKFSVENSLKYLENEEHLSSLTPFGATLFSADSLNFIKNGLHSEDKKIVEI